MFKKYLIEAYNAGSEVIVQMGYCFNSRLTGKIMDIDGECFQLFQINELNTTSWICKIEDVQSLTVFNKNCIFFENSNENKELTDGN